METRLEILNEKKVIGKRITTSITDNKTFDLWKSFMQLRKQIVNVITTDLYDVQTFDDDYWTNFNPQNTFEKWAAMEVANFDHVPDKMETLTIPPGLYIVFTHKGLPSEGAKTFEYIFGTWLPNSNYELDNRPHFGKMTDKYNNTDPASEEDLWIPVRIKP
ncbi:MAG: GyrI-like domain-containing protein [Bacteroidota bacterium]